MPPEDEDALGHAERAAPSFCTSGWKQQLFILIFAAVGVLGLAVRIRAMDNTPRAPGAAWATAPASGGAAATTDVSAAAPVVPVALEGAPFGARPVAATTRSSFNGAVARIRPATLAVRASYGADANGQLLERAGSAVVVDAAGYAVTCSHVVMGASAISVRRFQERERWSAARAVALDGDLALLQIADTEPLAAAVLGDSSRVGVGDWVLAVGHPFQLGLSVTAGIVSRQNATLTFAGGRQLADLIQTDAAINEGSSGGPLVNVDGEVVGINSAIYAPGGAFSGASFAIASNRVREFVASVLGAGARGRAGWGLGLATLTPALATQLAFPGSQGVVVTSVAPDSAAADAMLTMGDVITVIAGEPVRDVAGAMGIRARLPGTAAVSVEVWRLGTVRTVTIKPRAG